MGFLSSLSLLLGWTYTLCWSLSFYPQLLLNLRRRATTGSTVDFTFLNTFGFATYSVYTLALYTSPAIRSQYAFRNNGTAPTVQPNDIAFVLHAFLLTALTTTQYTFPALWRFPRQNYSSASKQPSHPALGIFSGSILAIVVTFLLVLASPRRNANDWCWLDVIYALSYAKIVITLVKYTPQIVANHRNKSTKGWTIWQIILDFSGGVLSIAQLLIDSYLIRDWSGVTGNPVKFALGNVSMLFDIVLMTQHYVLYAPGKRAHFAAESERGGLLDQDGEEQRPRLD